jgi:hypothetical protein
MKHIRTPVGICKRGSGRLHSDVLDAEGNYVAHEIETEHAQEIVAILNQHDALVAAVQAKQSLMDHIVFCTTCGTGAMCDDYHPLYIDEKLIREGE